MNRLAYTVAEAAELCSISERQMRRLIADGKIHAADMGDLRIGHKELERYLLGLPSAAVSTQFQTVSTASETVATPDTAPVRRSPSRPVTGRRKAHA